MRRIPARRERAMASVRVKVESVPGAQTAVRLDKGALPRAQEDHGADRHAVRAGQPVDGAAALGGCCRMSAPAVAARLSSGCAAPRRTPKAASKKRKHGVLAASSHLKQRIASRCAEPPKPTAR